MTQQCSELVVNIRSQLFDMQDEEYRDFHSRLIPTIEKNRIIGVRTPALRAYAARIARNNDYMEFLCELPHFYYEENNLHAFLIEKERNFNKCVELTDAFLPYVDNWATCDMMSPKVFGKHKAELISKINEWVVSDKTYTVRFGLKMLMTHFLQEDFSEEYLELASQIRSDEYYINMMIAWFFATALTYRYESTLPYLKNRALSDWCHNKTISKARESYRIPKERKEYLKTLIVKSKL